MEAAENLFNNLFFNPERYDLSKVGRYKLNIRSELNINETVNVLTPNDILQIGRHLLLLNDYVMHRQQKMFRYNLDTLF